jgi:hypothetical protein
MPTIWECQICVSARHNHVDQNPTSSLQYSSSSVPAVIQIDCEAVSFAGTVPVALPFLWDASARQPGSGAFPRCRRGRLLMPAVQQRRDRQPLPGQAVVSDGGNSGLGGGLHDRDCDVLAGEQDRSSVVAQPIVVEAGRRGHPLGRGLLLALGLRWHLMDWFHKSELSSDSSACW